MNPPPWKRLFGAGCAWMLIAGCAGTDGEQEAGPSVPEAEEGEQTLNVWLYQEPRQLNPLLSKHGPDEQLMSLVYDYLFAAPPDGEVQGSLAESWEVSDDATTYTIDLVDAEWSDGEPFTADDVVFSYKLLADPTISEAAGTLDGIAGVEEYVAGDADEISGLRTDGDDRVIVELSEPNAAWAEQVAGFHYVVPEHVLGDVETDEIADHEFFTAPTVALGPFSYVDRSPGEYVELARNPQYREEVEIDRMFLVEGDSDVATAQLEEGSLDLAFVSPTDVERMRDVEGLQVEPAPGVGQVRLAVATDQEPLGDPRVRQAIMHGVDREGIVAEALGGHGAVQDIPFLGPDWAIPNDLDTYEYDPDRARELLDEAGWDSEETVGLNIIPGTRDRDTTAEIIQGQLGEIGIQVRINQMESGPFGEAMVDRDFDLALYGGGLQHLHPNLEAVTHMCATAQPDGPNNSGYCEPEVDQLFGQGRATTDQDEQAEIYPELTQTLHEDVPYIWLYAPEIIWVHSDRLEGFEPIGDFGTAFWNAAEWSVSDG